MHKRASMQPRHVLLALVVALLSCHCHTAHGCDVCVEFTNLDGTLGTPERQCSALAAALTSFFKQGAEMAGFAVPEAGFQCTEQSSTKQVACAGGVDGSDVEPMADHFWQTGAMFDKAVGNMIGLGPVPCQDVGRVPEKHIRVYSACLAPLDEHTRYPLVPDCPYVEPSPASPVSGQQEPQQSQQQPGPEPKPQQVSPSAQPTGPHPGQQPQQAAGSPEPAPSSPAPKPSSASGGAPAPSQGQGPPGTGIAGGTAGDKAKGNPPPPSGGTKKPPPPRKRVSPPPRKMRIGTRN